MKKGFTLVEVLIAFAILLVSVSIPVGIVSSEVARNQLNRESIIARYLAQEAIEIIREERDNVFLNVGRGAVSEQDWLSPFSRCVGTSSTDVACDLLSNSFVLCDDDDQGGSCPDIVRNITSINEDTVSETGERTINRITNQVEYKRRIRVIRINENKAIVNVNLSWDNLDGSENSFSIEEELYKYLPF